MITGDKVTVENARTKQKL